jgi:CHAT domain-containing protein
VHITGAFQLAGFQHVVGTLWRVGDLSAVRLARDFYAALAVPGSLGTVDVSRAAVALHHATRRLRDRYPGSPATWAAHIHTGP